MNYLGAWVLLGFALFLTSVCTSGDKSPDKSSMPAGFIGGLLVSFILIVAYELIA